MPVDKFGNEIKQRGSTIKSDEGISLSFANNTYKDSMEKVIKREI